MPGGGAPPVIGSDMPERSMMTGPADDAVDIKKHRRPWSHVTPKVVLQRRNRRFAGTDGDLPGGRRRSRRVVTMMRGVMTLERARWNGGRC